MERKAVVLLSGGLDSTLAVRMMIEQDIAVEAVHFTSLFCNCTPKKAGCKLQAKKIADEMNIPIRVITKGMDYIRMVQDPPHGRGSGMNPCIDCRIYMLRKVREMMPSLGASFVVTGEVLAQRPMSQHRHTLRLIERESGLEGLILRPLSARHFEPTLPEEAGMVDRERLLDFAGRSRKPQIALAREWGIRDYPCPAGGCLLTDGEIAARLRDLFTFVPDYEMADLQLLKYGRHFRLGENLKVILGRNGDENAMLECLADPEMQVFTSVAFRGPLALARGTCKGEDADRLIGGMIVRYSQDRLERYRIQKQQKGGEARFFDVAGPLAVEDLEGYRISPKKSRRAKKHLGERAHGTDCGGQ